MVWRRGSSLPQAARDFIGIAQSQRIGPPALIEQVDIGNSDIAFLINEFAKAAEFASLLTQGSCRHARAVPANGRSTMKSFLKSCTALTRRAELLRPGASPPTGEGTRQGRRPGQHRRLAGYIERGETDKDYDWVTEFEKETGCKVNVKTAATSDEMVALMNEGGFDLVTASGDASLRLVAGKRVQPINTDLIPSWKTVDDRLQGRALVHGRRRPLRRALSVGPERADVQHRRLQGSAEELERRVRGDERCRTASPTRAASRPMTARSISPTPPTI